MAVCRDASSGNAIKIWRAPWKKPFRELGKKGAAFALKFSPDDKLLAAGAAEGNVVLVDVESGRIVRPFKHGKNIVYALAFHPKGTKLAAGSQDGIKFFDIAKLKSGGEAKK